jgi:hypothetical protein
MAWEELQRLDAFSDRTYPMDDIRGGYLAMILAGMEAAQAAEVPHPQGPSTTTVWMMDNGADQFAAQQFLRYQFCLPRTASGPEERSWLEDLD